ncbi:MAG: RlmE family RNA methyltransferase [Methylocystis sp.]|nr:RlmE family RNA methyltransferase [Methylocystis sp.]MCA3584477.1 RlmE family RNA methyltransferase [Methylocystis sp.]MCA3588018.1 RlmE family RNA methyltransferase [Methylocystis sp.]MCA3590501.1 RlmE family RNA methyltransferase [Methylocystis sp.]
MTKDRPSAGKPPKPKNSAGKPQAAGKQGGAASAPKTPGGHSSGKKVSAKPKDPRFAERVHTAHKRSLSSIIWLQRQLNDPYVMRAKEEGWRSRAAFKLIEIDEKHRILKHGQIIVDLGAAPGGWSQYAAKKVGSVSGRGGKVIGIDLLPIEPIAGVTLAEMDFTEEDAPARLLEMLGTGPGKRMVDGVLSDMAANTTGHRKTDHLRIVGLTEMAVDFAIEVLKPGGFFVTKLFQGGETAAMITLLKQHFAVVKHVKPQASRADSAELYVLATGFKS